VSGRDAVCPNCEKTPYAGTHHGTNVYRCRNPYCDWYTAPLARTKAELRRVVATLGGVGHDD
jgi:hypothetical protein